MKVLITGGAGFIGHHLVRATADRGDEVRILDDFSTGMQSRLTPFLDRVQVEEGSILDGAALDRVMEGCEVVLHLAALPSVARSVKAPRQTNEVNASGTIEVMLAAARAGVRRVVLAASSSAYGDSPSLPSNERQSPAPLSPYAASKVAAEFYLHTLGELNGIATVALRYFNVFGPSQDPASEYAAVVPKFITAVLGGASPIINGDGSVSRDFTFIDNVVHANLLAARADTPRRLTCNIGCGERHTLIDLLAEIQQVAGNQVEPVFGPPRPGDIPHSQADISLASRALGYEVVVPFAEGIARTVEWYRQRGEGDFGGSPAPPQPSDG